MFGDHLLLERAAVVTGDDRMGPWNRPGKRQAGLSLRSREEVKREVPAYGQDSHGGTFCVRRDIREAFWRTAQNLLTGGGRSINILPTIEYLIQRP